MSPGWPLKVGDRPAEKLAWILSENGHGSEWARVLHIGQTDSARLWQAIVQALPGNPIHRVAERHGTVCGVEMTIRIGVRTANARTSWHYRHAQDHPRLVTAYPKL